MKKIHRFLLKEIPNTTNIVVTDSDTVHLMKTVLHLATGESCIVFCDRSDDYLCTIEEIRKQEISLSVQSIIPKRKDPRPTTACISITKRDTFELVVQKLTEIGVSTIIPLLSERTIKQSLRLDRLQKISDEALEQSGGSTRVIITEPQTLTQTLEQHNARSQCYFDMDGSPLTKKTSSAEIFYIGPEGGWSDEEKKLFSFHTVPCYTLGAPVLRAETATIIAGYTLLWD